MATPKYFQNFPDLSYAMRANKAGHPNYFRIKDYFHLLRVRDDIIKEETLYVDYVVKDGQRPDQVSYELYGDEQFYWVILQINDIVHYYNQWPLSYKELEEYSKDKYGGVEGLDGVHHYVTQQTLDGDGNLVLPADMIVYKDFKFEYPATPGSTVYLTSFSVPVSNFDYEKDLNDKKSQIQVLSPKNIYEFDREVRRYGAKLVRATKNEDQRSIIDLSELQ